MKASRLIELLQKTIENHGDLDVVAYNRTNECDGRVRKVKVHTYGLNGETQVPDEEYGMPYYCAGDSVLDVDKQDGKDVFMKQFVVLYND